MYKRQVEYQISEKFVVFKQDSFLAGYKRKTVAQLQQKRLDVYKRQAVAFVFGQNALLSEELLNADIFQIIHNVCFSKFSDIALLPTTFA